MIIPVGGADHQELQLVERHGGAFPAKILEGCRFVPLVGYHGWQEPT
jgi:protein-L-isoaspartate O-methyltransferase